MNKEDWPVVDAWVEATVRAVAQLSLKTFAELGVGEHGTLALQMGSAHGKAACRRRVLMGLGGGKGQVSLALKGALISCELWVANGAPSP